MPLCGVCGSDPRYIVECELCVRCLCLACSCLSRQEIDVLLEDTRRLLYFCQQCKAKIPDFRNQLGLDPNKVPPRSESPPPDNNTVLPREVREQLVHILNSLSNRHTNHQDALSKLLDIKERYPETDVWSCMQGSSFHFRSFVERGLADAAERRRFPRLNTHHHNNENDNENDNETEEDENMHMVYMERLWKLQAKAGMPLSQPSFVTPSAGGDATLTLADSSPLTTRSHNIDPQFELRATATSNCSSEQANVEALRLKLQQIKNASRR